MSIVIVSTVVLAVILIVMSVQLFRALVRFRIKKTYTTAIAPPSVSVCIPARNETHAMTQCLERVLASDYEKMEIIVFDDSSTDDTSVLVKSFAHAGVRFVPGTPLPKGWLGKNHALEVLAREASGTYVIFMDVDTHVRPATVSQLVGYAMTENVDMVSVVPQRYDSWRPSVLFGHMRYFWELVFSRSSAPAVSSALWLVKRQTLFHASDGFTGLKANVAPEGVLAKLLGAKLYRCLLSDTELGVTYEKRWASQAETSKRLLYPKAGGTWWRRLLALAGLFFLNVPLFGIIGGAIFSQVWIVVIAIVLLAGYSVLYSVYTYYTRGRGWLLGGLLWPVVVFQEMILFAQSMWGYARHTVTWKGRRVDTDSTAIAHRAE